MKARPKNFGEALIPLTTVSTIIGHGGSHCTIVQQHPIANSIYAIIVTSLYCVAFGFTLDFCFHSSWLPPGTIKLVIVGLICANTFVAGLAWMHSWYYAKIHASYAKEISLIDKTLRRCGSSFDYVKTFKLGIVAICIELIAFCVMNTMEIIWLVEFMPVYQILIINCILLYPIYVKSMVVCHFSLKVWLIGERFVAANKIMEKAIDPSQQLISDEAWPSLGNAMNTSTFAISTHQILNTVLRRQNILQIIKHVHLELCAISKKLNQAYGLQIALAMGIYLVTITAVIIDCHKEMLSPSKQHNMRIIMSLIWTCTYFGEFMLVNQVCEKVCAEAERTGKMIHCMNQSIGNTELRAEINQFSLQLIQHPLHFSPAGLFVLGSEFVVGFIASVLTYATIFVQINYQLNG